ncbi:MAG: branched-chain amino acid transport system substrate-binding protein [Solirubrobacteraceae bacterium]|nr:branched-chain amino acid transport system substrate-binding protein [Solirubrobacteraceae bacterium]
MKTRLGSVCLLVAAATGIAACGSSSSKSTSGGGGGGGGNTVDIYSSLPLQGASSAQTMPMVNGIRLALAQANNKAGTFDVNYQSLDDSTAQAGKWDASQTNANARKVAQDGKAVYYIGDFNSGASKLSIPILNSPGIAEVSPANTYVGLTTNEPGSAPGEPGIYYPSGKRNYLRIVPRDKIQAAAILKTMKSDGCSKAAIANDKDTYGQGLAALLELQKGAYGITITSNTGIDPKQPNFRTYAQTIKSQGADCFVFSGIVANGGVQITKDVAAALPNAKIYGPDGMCTNTWTNPAKGGVPLSIDKNIQCTVATLDLSAYPGGKTFLAAYKAKYGDANPDPYAIYGYEAMKLGLDTIAGLGPKGNDRAAVLAALFATKARQSVLGKYGFDANGDTTLKAYGLYKVGPDGNPLFEKTVT